MFFPGFRFETDSGRLWRGEVELAVRPRSAQVLAHLAARPGEVVGRRELLEAVWPEGFITEAALTVCISELRHALGDDAREPRYIATVHGRGYRFQPALSTAPVGDAAPVERDLVVGREAELAALEGAWAEARSGRRQLTFIAGDAGLGKSALVELFATRIRAAGGAMIGRGQCVEHFGEGEAYMPVFEALTELCHGPNGQWMCGVLAAAAPSWLWQLPGLVDASELESLELRLLGTTPGRMLREIAGAFDGVAAQKTVLLILEDLHDSDPSTVELVSYLARRPRPAALMIVGTYRPAEAAAGDNPLHRVVQDLRARRLCDHLTLGLLPATAVRRYIARRLEPRRPSPDLVADVHERTDGNPLFVATMLDHLLDRDLLVAKAGEMHSSDHLERLGLPDTLRQSIELQIGSTEPADRRLLSVAAVAGVEFTTDAVAAGLGGGVEMVEVEDRCEWLVARMGLVVPAGATSLPDGTETSIYRFGHSLYREVLYEHHLSRARRAEIHRRIGERMAETHGQRIEGVAAELAMHFERGRDARQAVHYLTRAANASLERSAHTEARDHIRRGLEVIEQVPAGVDRSRMELQLHLSDASALTAAKGFHAPEAERAYRRADALAVALGDDTSRVAALYGLRNVFVSRGDIHAAAQRSAELERLVQWSTDPAVQLQTHTLMGFTLLFMGEIRRAMDRVEQALQLYDPVTHRRLALRYGEDPGVVSRLYGAIAAWLLGEPSRARALVNEGLRLARDLAYPAGITQALWYSAVVYQLCGDVDRVRSITERILHDQDGVELPLWSMLGVVLNGWARAQGDELEKGIEQMQKGMARLAADGVGLIRPYHASLLAGALSRLGDAATAHLTVTEALETARRTGERWFEAELLRQHAELIGSSDPDSAQAALREALDVARRQQVRSLELRVALSLADCWEESVGDQDGHAHLARVLESFTEGHDTVDLTRAAAVLSGTT